MKRPAPNLLQTAVLLITLLGACWALVSPLGSVPDEPAHVLYAAAVVRGDLGTGPKGQAVVVPKGVGTAGASACTAFKPSATADCAPELGTSREPVATITGAGRYPPLYYALVGWPTLIGFGEATWYAMRLLSVLLAGALLLLATTTWRRHPPVLVAGLLLAATPMVGFMLGSVNPNGVEIVAGTALVLAAAGLADTVRAGGRATRREGVTVAGLTACLALARPGSYTLAVALLAVLGLASLDLLRRRPQAAAALGAACVAAVALGFVCAQAVAPPPAAVPLDGGVSLGAAAITVRASAWDWLQETVGIFGWRDHQPTAALRVLWLAVSAALVAFAAFHARWTQRLALGSLVVGAAVAAPLFVFVTLFRDGVGYQARYAMALTQAIPVLAAAVLAGQGRQLPRWGRLLPPLLAVLGALALGGSALRYAVGLPLPGPGGLPDAVVWLPPAWPLVLLLLPVCGVLSASLSHSLSSPSPVGPDRGLRASMSE